jgi:hypothetical protein
MKNTQMFYHQHYFNLVKSPIKTRKFKKDPIKNKEVEKIFFFIPSNF